MEFWLLVNSIPELTCVVYHSSDNRCNAAVVAVADVTVVLGRCHPPLERPAALCGVLCHGSLARPGCVGCYANMCCAAAPCSVIASAL